MPVEGADLVTKNILIFTRGFIREVNKGMGRVRVLLDDAITRNISLRDHSLKQLARLGHPYSRRSNIALHSPEYQVHIQSGRMIGAKISGVDDAQVNSGSLKARAWAGISASRAPHALHVVYGTSRMVPRDFLIGSLGEVRERAILVLRGPLKNAVVSFNGERTKL